MHASRPCSKHSLRRGLGVLALGLTLGVAASCWTTAPAAAQGSRHWSLQPIEQPALPMPEAAGKLSEVDRFLEARLREAKLRAAGPASPHALLRRITFELTGLPPTPAEIAAFVAAPSDAAYARVVDRLLASPAFGERWGRHWLDVARFAESSGGGRSLMFENAWRFRDYVIDAYNADRPFDVFVTEQIAGDLMPFESDEQRNRQLVASGFLELGPTNYELQDKELLVMDVIDEQIDTMGQAFLGMTLGCARCHDHKFDPVPAQDYYALAGIFGSTSVLTPGNVSGWTKREFAGARTRTWHLWRRRVAKLEGRIADMSPTPKAKNKRSKGNKRPRPIDRTKLQGIVLDDVDAEKTGAWIPSKHVSGYLGLGYIHDENTEKGHKSVRFTPVIPRDGSYELRISYTHGSNRASNTPVHIDACGKRHELFVNQRRAASLDGPFMSLGNFTFEKGTKATITISNTETDGHVIVDAIQLLPSSPDTLGPPVHQALAALETELAALKAREPLRPQRAMAAKDVAEPRDGYFHNRGLVRSRGARVPRGFLSACGNAKPQIPEGQSGRLQLAEWLTNPEHPLTARVYVNRVWHWLFGTGLVRTVDNFGTKGERPSHPDLLDWLAHRFVKHGWSTKRLVRELVLTKAYRRRVAESPARDPENRLLSHYPRRRLDAEAIRDAMLAVSGRLDRTRGGNTIRKMAQYDYAYRFDSRRRSVYVPRFRSKRLPLFDIFDAPDPSMVAGARNVSNVAPQALFLMNNPWVREQAQHAARAHASALAAAGAIDHIYLLSLGRRPHERERTIAARFLGPSPTPSRWRALIQTLFASLDFRYLH